MKSSLQQLVGMQLVDAADKPVKSASAAVTKDHVDNIVKANGFKEVRYCSTDGFTDMEFREERVKITTNPSGVIEKVAIG